MATPIPEKGVIKKKATALKFQTQLLINGKFQPSVSGKTFESINPSTEEKLADVAAADASDIDLAVKSARKAFETGPWARMSGRERGRILYKAAQLIREHAEEFMILESMDNGKPVRESAWAAPVSAEVFEYYAGWADKYYGEVVPLKSNHLNYVLHEPVGVVGAIIPWNFPTTQATFKTLPAVAMGNSVILKPAEQTPLTSLLMGQLCLEAGMPEGVWNVVPGIGEVAGRALVAHPDVDAIAFTGSTVVGKEIMRVASETLKKVSLELGGKSPNIVFADADIDAAVQGAIFGIFYNQGEVCNAGTRLFLQENIYDIFMEKLINFAKSRVVGDPLDPDTQMGAIVSKEQLEKDLFYIDQGKKEGANLLAGGQKLNYTRGFYLQPTIFGDVDNTMRIAQEEIFGPILSVIKFKDMEDAIKLANETMYGLAAGVWTKDVKIAHTMARRLKNGTVWINLFGPFDIASPWTGWKQSGVGTEWGRNMLEFVTNVKSVWVGL